MLIWTNYYSKRANDLCNRVLGTNKIIGIYKITNLKTKEVYIGQSVNYKSADEKLFLLAGRGC